MKNNLFYVTFISIFIWLTGYYFWTQQNKLVAIETTKTQIESTQIDMFQKAKECALIKDEMIVDIMNPRLVRKDLDPIIEEIFFSEKLDSCLYIVKEYPWEFCITGTHEQYIEWKCMFKDRLLFNFFTKEILETENSSTREKLNKCEEIENFTNEWIEKCNERFDFNTRVNNYK